MPPKPQADPARAANDCSDDPCCVSPCDPPWLTDDECLISYEDRTLRRPLDRDRGEVGARLIVGPAVEFRVTYEHRLCRRGKQHGPLVYTVTLLPGEKVTLYHSERYRRITSEQDRFSVATTFMQFVSTVHQARVTNTFDDFRERLSSSKSGASGSVGGGLASLFGAPSGSASTSTSVQDERQVSVGVASDQFNQSVRQASMLTHAERSVVVSTFEDKETADVTARSIQNDNACRAVTYFVRQVVELYTVSTVVYDVTFRILASGVLADWHTLDDLDGLPEEVQRIVKETRERLPRVGETAERDRTISIPTDGTVYDPELANCCSCEPERSHRANLEDQLLELEIERRRMLLAAGTLTPFEPVPSATPAVAPTP